MTTSHAARQVEIVNDPDWQRPVYVLDTNAGSTGELWRAVPARDVACPLCGYKASMGHFDNIAGLFWDAGAEGGDILRCECGYYFPIEDWFAGALDGLSLEATREVLLGTIDDPAVAERVRGPLPPESR